MGRPSPTTSKGSATRDRIVAAAQHLVRERGVAAVTIDRVQEHAEVGRSQMYHYFDGRDDLIAAVVDATIDAVLGWNGAQLAAVRSVGGIDRWFAGVEAACTATGGVGGCPIGSLVGQLAEQDEGARLALARAFDRWTASLGDALTRLRESGELRADVDVDELADATMATLQGGLLLAQVRRDPNRLRRVLDGARSTIDAAGA